jgi:ABC-type sugar transport system ATPase subunit
LHQDLGATMIYVTHDQVEAMTLADRMVVLRDGRIEQVGTPMQIYLDPANAFVAGFVGSPKMNFLDARITAVSGDGCWVNIPALATADYECRTLRSRPAVGTDITVGIRSEHIEECGAEPGFAGTIAIVERLGSVSYAYVETACGARMSVERRVPGADKLGDTLHFRLMPDRVFAFSRTGERL